ncbi:MAG: phosphodiester glycosidase family protein [Clostridia bacterium]|nr:phosphodiester glycosidase family protein [Clostridia bacterium]
MNDPNLIPQNETDNIQETAQAVPGKEKTRPSEARFFGAPEQAGSDPAERETEADLILQEDRPGAVRTAVRRRAVRSVTGTADEKPEEKGKKDKPRAMVGKAYKKAVRRRVIGRICLCFFSLIAFILIGAVITCHVLLKERDVKVSVVVDVEDGKTEPVIVSENIHGTTLRNTLVQSAKNASATKWLPGLFLDKKLVNEIVYGSKIKISSVMNLDDVKPGGQGNAESEDEWATAIDGIRFETVAKPTFKAYVLLVRDPSRVFVGWGADYKAGRSGGMKIFGIAEKYGAVAAINGGEFSDVGGMGTGDLPMGLTFSRGSRYSGSTGKTFMGFDKDNKLVVSEGMSLERATELGIRDGVSFQTGNALITNDGSNVTCHYAPGNTGVAQRTCIAQRADGTVILLVTDGRTAQSLGATYDDCINLLLEYGAVSAGMLDGGSSAMMYYRNYYDLYHYDVSQLDEYQRQGLINKYKAFTKPRTIPTYFVVGEAQNNG